MNKLIIALMVLVGVSMANTSFASEERMIPLKAKSVLHANTVISASGVDLYKITGVADSSNTVWAAYNVSTIAAATGVAANSQANILVEGGEATQYDALGPYDFGPDGLRFSTGLVIITTTADLSVIYR